MKKDLSYTSGVISSSLSGLLLEIPVTAYQIQNQKNNKTRFIVIT